MKKYLMLVIIMVAVACKKDDPPLPPEEIVGPYENGLVILNEGLFQQNNASLSFYSFANQQSYTQAFVAANGRGLGDTANDFVKYTLNGVDYIIIAVDISSQIEIVEAATLKSVAQIPLFNGTQAREPRRIKVYNDKAFICNFDGTVVVVDLVNYSVLQTISVGANPDGLASVGHKLFVSNSGGLNYPVYNSTVTVINMDNYSVLDNFETRINSTSMIVDAQNEIYLLSAGNYGSITPALVRINSSTHAVVQNFDIPIGAMTQIADWIYYYDQNQKGIFRLNSTSEILENILVIDCSGYETFFGIQYIAANHLIYCVDAKGYVNTAVIKAYDTSGNFQYQFTAELNPKNIIYNP